jgi:FAD/FMN-containing dehydrogenase
MHLLTDDMHRDLARSDTYGRGEMPQKVVVPETVEELIASARELYAQEARLFIRAGGLSYINCFRPDSENSVVIDIARLNRILEINVTDGYVVVEPGCTWKTLHETLKAKGVRARFWGTFPGAVSTVGGTISQDGCHYGSGKCGPAGEAVLGLEVLLPNGELLRTGSWAREGGTPFARSFGPDLSGLFINDSGALGIKTRIALRIEPLSPYVGGICLGYQTLDDLLADYEAIGRYRMADNIAFDRTLSGIRFTRQKILALTRSNKKLVDKENLRSKLSFAMGGARALAADYTRYAYVLHLTVDAESRALLQEKIRFLRSQRTGRGRLLPPIVSLGTALVPFAALTSVLGPNNEVAAPLHAKLAMSAVKPCQQALHSLMAKHRDRMAATGVWWSELFQLIGGYEMLYEPILYLPDAPNAQQRAFMLPAGTVAANPAGRDLVDQLRREIFDVFADHRAAHFHIGAEIPFAEKINDPACRLLSTIRDHADPARSLNPTVFPGI